MLRNLAMRLTFILCFAVGIRVVGGLLSPYHAKPAMRMIAVTDRFGSTHMVPAGLMPAGAEAPTSDEMRAAIQRVRQRNPGWGPGSGAKLTFGSGGPNPVVTTPAELAAAREDLHRLNRSIEDQYRRVEREEQAGAVSFAPGRPMIDPTPRR